MRLTSVADSILVGFFALEGSFKRLERIRIRLDRFRTTSATSNAPVFD